MRRLLPLFALFALGCSEAPPEGPGDAAFNGRWIIAPQNHPAKRAMWLEVNGAGTPAISGSAIGGGPGGQLDPIVDAKIENGELTYRVDRHVGRGERRRLVETPSRARVVGDELHGSTDSGDGIDWIGYRAPEITDRDDGSWREGETLTLFDGTNLDAWETLNPGRDQEWFVEDGVMKNHEQADVLKTKESFWNFRLQVEYRVRPGMNGGIGLRSRYEIQILDDHGQPSTKSGNGALYSRVPPSVNASKPADEWQTFDITFIGRDVTVVLNDQTIIDKAVVDGFTAMATDWHESEPGPITLQGDHGAVEFRKILLTKLEQ